MTSQVLQVNNTENKIINNNIHIKTEKHIEQKFNNNICLKPWGHEFQVYQNNKIGIWFLKINKNHKTSLHCHFNKDTIIIVIKGAVKLELINGEIINLNCLDCLYIPHYKFHSLGTFSEESYILEIEVYNNSINFSDKNDLLRIDDKYNRTDNLYSTSIKLLDSDSKDFDTYDYFYFNKNFDKKVQGVDIKLVNINSSNNLADLKKNKYNIILDGIIFQNMKYLKEGSFIDSFENLQFMEDQVSLLCINKDDYFEDSKIIYSLDQLKYIIAKLKNNNQNIILTSGCFDILHVGHLNNLLEAKKLGDILMVCLSNDEQIKKLKGEDRPINNYDDRINLFKTIKYVDYIILYEESNIETEQTLGNIMKIVDPFYWVKGSDYTIDNIIKKHPYLKQVKLVDNIKNKSTTNIIKKIKK